MNIDELCSKLNPDIIEKFKRAIEIGQWPDGRTLTKEQKETCMQAVIVYEHKFLNEAERTGFVPPKPTPCDTDGTPDPDIESPIRWE